VPVYLQAGLWGLVAGGVLVVGAAIAWLLHVPRLVVATVMAFGSGVLFSALAFDLVDEAERSGGLTATLIGLAVGAAVYVALNVELNRRGAARRKSDGEEQSSEQDQAGSGTAIAVGALLDGVPESVVLGLSLLGGHGVGVPVLAAIAISNLPEGLSSSAGMKANGRSARYVFGVWVSIAVASGLAGLVGCLVLDGAADSTISVITAIAAGAILTMVADTMIPEAYARTHLLTGLVVTLGFITAFALTRA
jgi:zinc transporter, ZIP family